MNKALAFAKLDYITIKPYLTLKNLAIILPLLAFITYGTGDISTMIGMLMMYGTIYATYPFAAGDRNGIDTLYASLPLRRGSVVAGRYIFALCLNILLSAVSFCLAAVFAAAFGKEFDATATAITILVCFLLFTIVLAVQMPIYFKLGYTKAKLLAYLPLAGFPAVVIAAGAVLGKDNLLPLIDNVFLWLSENSLGGAVFITLIWAAAILVSAGISTRTYKKREF